MTDDDVKKIFCALGHEELRKAEMFDYLCWLEETQQSDAVKSVQFLVMASDHTTCWGRTYAEAVSRALLHDKELYEAVQEMERTETNL